MRRCCRSVVQYQGFPAIGTRQLSAITLRSDSSGVLERRRRPAANNRRGLVDQLVVLDCLHHEQGEVHAARDVALEDGVAHVPPSRVLSPSPLSLSSQERDRGEVRRLRRRGT